jgi:hypothetical protein
MRVSSPAAILSGKGTSVTARARAWPRWPWHLLHEPRTVWRRALVYGPQSTFFPLRELMQHKRKTEE